ncbi:hypothetical protein ACHAWF_004582 [Thalassiosira exigua]
MYIDEMAPSAAIPSLLSLSLPAPESIKYAPTNIFCATAKLIPSDPQVEAGLLNDVSQIALDVSTFISPNTVWLRLCNMIGRILVLSSDYVQADHVATDEWVFQASMLVLSMQLFLRSAWPLMVALVSTSTLSVRDRRAYARLFDSVGLTVLQFKTLLASCAVDWVDFAPNSLVELNEEQLYVLYSGDANEEDFTRAAANDSSACVKERLRHGTRTFGEVQFAKALDTFVHKKSKKISKSSKTSSRSIAANSTISSQGCFVVGPNGATMLRITTPKLLKLMENDDELSSSMQRLVLRCMQEKLSSSQSELNLRSKMNVTVPCTPNATYLSSNI